MLRSPAKTPGRARKDPVSRTLCPILIMLTLAIVSPAGATTWIVAGDGSGDYISVQEAVGAASFADTIRVRPGTYHERVNLLGQALSLIGDGGADATTLDADGTGSVLTIPYTPGGPTLVKGFTFTGGNGTILTASKRQERYGGGIFVELAFGRIEDCRIVGNVANHGGGIFVMAGTPRFVRCTIAGNSSGVGGGVAVENDGGVVLQDCSIEGNDAVFGGGIDSFRGRIRLDHCRVLRNRAFEGGGIRIVGTGASAVRIDGSLLARNGGDVGGAILCRQGALDVESTTVAENDSIPSVGLIFETSQVALRSLIVFAHGTDELIHCQGGNPLLECVVLWPQPAASSPCTAGPTVLAADPLFCGSPDGDYTLRPDSPCLPGQGPAGCGQIGAFGVGCGIPVPVESVSWGHVKGLFR
jgi:hypothetical protein